MHAFAQSSDNYPGENPGDNIVIKPFFSSEVTTEDYIVLSGHAHHFSSAPKVIGHWNEANYGLGYQRSFKEKESDYRYSLEGGFFKESFGKMSAYMAAAALRDFYIGTRVSFGAMIGLSYRVNTVKDGYYAQHKYGPIDSNHTPIPIYDSREVTPLGGLIAQVEIPYTPAVIQTTFLPKLAGNSSAVLFTQLLVKF